MRKTWRWPALLAAALLCAGLWWWQGSNSREATEPAQPVVVATEQRSEAARRWSGVGQDPHFSTGLESLPRSLAGTEPPDGLRVDSQGNLVVTLSLRDLFDYFLSTLGEEDLQTIIARLRAYLAHHLPEPAAAEANRVLDNYLAFRESLKDLQPEPANPAGELDIDAIRQHHQAIRDQRQAFFSAEVDQAFFADEDVWHDYGLSRAEILEDESLDPRARSEQLTSLRQSLPGTLDSDLDAILKYQDLQALSADLVSRGGNEADLRLLREQVVGAEAADRLEMAEQERARFQARVDSWLQTRDALLSDQSLAPVDRESQVDQLRARQFSEQELIRVTTLERLHDQARPPPES